VSEPESIASRTAQASVTRTDADDLPPDLAARAIPEREGLPRNYRMRAGEHYVDQLESPAPPVIRMVKTGQIDCRDLPSSDELEELTRSIGIHGVLQPLLVRRQGPRYNLIAGRRRLAGAIAAGLSVVPCALHDVEGAAAAALAAADNVRGDSAGIGGETERHTPSAVLDAMVEDLTTIRTAVALLRSARPGALSNTVGAELVESHAARAAWLLSCLLGTFEHTSQVPLAAVVQRVADQFGAQSSLGPMELHCSVSPAAAVWKVPEESVTAAISGAVFAMLACLEGSPRQRIELHADAQHPRSVRVEVVQRAARVPATLGSDDIAGLTRQAELIPALALRLARQVAAPLGGTAELTPLPGVGSVLQITFGQTS
jgi:hypothetical protein